ncbi:MAG: polyprenyl synthetase family protein [Lachnospiraceae bacterium]|nr:polyprenyl synthetase family protein [Lachnospiraceae bacterium]
MDKIILKSKIEYINDILEKNLPGSSEPYGKECEAMRYSVLNGGKRLRAIMLMESFRMFCDNKNLSDRLLPAFITAIESIHGASLVHDDLPAMDNDVLRRGKPTTHVAFGHAMGVLAGDALFNYPFEITSKISDNLDESDGETALRILKAIRVLSVNAGYSGMMGGQVLDTTEKYNESIKTEGFNELEMLSFINEDIAKLKFILRIYELKTSRLIQAALMCGAILGGADKKDVKLLEDAGYALGIAFQIEDDILDMTSDAATLGKSVNIDEKNDKDTVARIYGLDNAGKLVEFYTNMAVKSLKNTGKDVSFLCELFESLIYRKL